MCLCTRVGGADIFLDYFMLIIQGYVCTLPGKIQSPSGSYDIANKTYVDTNFVKKNSDTAMSAKLTAQSNTAYITKQVRNIVLWTSGSTPPSTSYGDIVIKTF